MYILFLQIDLGNRYNEDEHAMVIFFMTLRILRGWLWISKPTCLCKRSCCRQRIVGSASSLSRNCVGRGNWPAGAFMALGVPKPFVSAIEVGPWPEPAILTPTNPYRGGGYIPRPETPVQEKICLKHLHVICICNSPKRTNTHHTKKKGVLRKSYLFWGNTSFMKQLPKAFGIYFHFQLFRIKKHASHRYVGSFWISVYCLMSMTSPEMFVLWLISGCRVVFDFFDKNMAFSDVLIAYSNLTQTFFEFKAQWRRSTCSKVWYKWPFMGIHIYDHTYGHL